MKKIIVCILLIMVVLPLEAQVVFGVRAGGAYSALIYRQDGVAKAGGRFGYSAAGIMEIPLHKRLSLRPEVALTNQGGKYLTVTANRETFLYRTFDYYSLQIPVNIQFIFTTPEITFGVFGGPYVDFSLWGKTKMDGQKQNIQFGRGVGNDLKPFDLGANLGLNVEYSNFFFTVQAFCGALNRRTDRQPDESNVYQNNVTFSLGYMFR